MSTFKIQDLAIPGVSLLIAFLGYSSQYLFLTSSVLPQPATKRELTIFNILLLTLWLTYFRACFTTSGRVPKDWKPLNPKTPSRWCKKCDRVKPQRTHHCKTCNACVVRMDHHCPWTGNCVGARNLGHFVRFLVFATVAMGYLESWLVAGMWELWKDRAKPSYLGPSVGQLLHLFSLSLINSLTLFLLSILLIRVLWAIGENKTSIESWEIERHETVARRARMNGGYIHANGNRVKVELQEFPFDIGIWSNFKAAFGTSIIPLWINPLAFTPPPEFGLENEHNELEDISLIWPPPDPEKMPRRQISGLAFTYGESPFGDPHDVSSFKKRQQADLHRQKEIQRQRDREKARYRRGMHDTGVDESEDEEDSDDEELQPWERSWTNGEGETLADFGVDENADAGVVISSSGFTAEEADEDDIPLAELLRRRKAR